MHPEPSTVGDAHHHCAVLVHIHAVHTVKTETVEPFDEQRLIG
jgi:hypothetical protein